MSLALSLPTGLGVCVHLEMLGDASGSESMPEPFPWAGFVRVDDFTVDHWDAGPGPTNSIRTLRAIHQWYRDFGFRVCQDIGADWSDHMIDHARNLISMGTVDLLLLPNEPDQHGITAGDYAEWARLIKTYAFQFRPYARLGGPQLSTWDLSPTSPIQTWIDDFENAGGMEWIDVFCIHPYTQASDPTTTIPTWLADPDYGILKRAQSKPLIFTEMGAQRRWCDDRFGDFTASNMAAFDLDYIAGCGPYPCAVYDAIYDLNSGGYEPQVGTAIAVGSATTTQFVGSVVDMIVGMPLAFVSSTLGFLGIRSIVSIDPVTPAIVVDSAIATSVGDSVTSKDYNASCSYWIDGAWASGHSGLTPLGALLKSSLPAR